MAKKHPTNIHFDHDMWTWLKEEAARQRCSIGHLIRQMVLKEMQSE